MDPNMARAVQSQITIQLNKSCNYSNFKHSPKSQKIIFPFNDIYLNRFPIIFSLALVCLLPPTSFLNYHLNLIDCHQVSTTTGARTTPKEISKLNLEQLCSDCRLTSQSVEDLIGRPRQMDAYGHVESRIDLDKIKKTVCREILNDDERERCRRFYFEQQASILKWKQQQETSHRKNKITFLDSICIRQLKLCCPEQSFGPKCTKCTKCGPNQNCHGEGTRSGNGSCICKLGHTGKSCSNCLPGFYLDESVLKLPDSSSKKLLCKPCHRSCLYCRKESPLGCEVCQQGFIWVPDFGCSDIDECLESNQQICHGNSFCVNTEGSHYCYECDRACQGCQGDGPDMCLRCARGYKLENGNCVAIRKTILPPEANYYRYAIYIGLCVSTCIILHNSVYLASLIGLGVALYIGFSEYIMAGHPGNQQELSRTTSNADAVAANFLSSHFGL